MNQRGLHTSEWMLISTFVLTLQYSKRTQTHMHVLYRNMYDEPSHLTAADWKIRKQIRQMNEEKYFSHISDDYKRASR